MFDAVADVALPHILMGVIWALALGFAVGNYACSLVHRLPRNKPMLDKTPYCGSCGTLLKVKDLFPVVSAMLLRHKCRYCGTSFPTSHTWTEVLVGLLFVFAFFKFNFTEPFILVILIGTFLITLAAIEANENIVMGRILLCVLVPAMLLRTLQDGTIYNFFEGGLYGLMIGAFIKRKEIRKVGHVFLPHPLAYLLAVGGASVGAKNLLLYLALFTVLWLVSKVSRKIPLTVPFGVATMIMVMYPQQLLELIR